MIPMFGICEMTWAATWQPFLLSCVSPLHDIRSPPLLIQKIGGLIVPGRREFRALFCMEEHP